MNYNAAQDQAVGRWHDEALAGFLAVMEAAPDAAVTFYPTWTVRHLAVHVVRVHEMASASLRVGGLQRPTFAVDVDPTASVDALRAALMRAATQMRRNLNECRHPQVWTPSPSTRPAFWRRRMLSESALHRWDADNAARRTWTPEDDLALELIDEFLATRLTGVVSPTGEPAAPRIAAGVTEWMLDQDGGEDVLFAGAPADVWLWLNRRAPLANVRADGPVSAIRAVEESLDSLSRARI